MRRRGRATAVLFLAVLAVWLAFVVHRAPRFAGSALGAAFGIAGASLLVVSSLYGFVRRIPFLRRRVSLAKLLRVHVACGFAGAILALVHTGHHFAHPVGIALTAAVLLVALTGYVGHDLLRRLEVRHAERSALHDRLAERLRREVGTVPSPAARALADELADIELAHGASERARRWLHVWAPLHVVIAVLWLALLAVHVWSAFYFGVRW